MATRIEEAYTRHSAAIQRIADGAYREGHHAGRMDTSECPYGRGTEAQMNWSRGRRDGRQHQRELEL